MEWERLWDCTRRKSFSLSKGYEDENNDEGTRVNDDGKRRCKGVSFRMRHHFYRYLTGRPIGHMLDTKVDYPRK